MVIANIVALSIAILGCVNWFLVGVFSWNGNEFEIEEFFPKCATNEDIFFWDEENIKTASVKVDESVNFINSFMEFSGEKPQNAFELLLKLADQNNVDEEVKELIKIYKDKYVF